MGYTKEVDWMEATAAELLVLHYIQESVKDLDARGLNELKAEMSNQQKLFRSLGFKLVSSPYHVPRKRKPRSS
jgi:hypothetical protein